MHVIYQELARMQERIEVLETILLDRQKSYVTNDTHGGQAVGRPLAFTQRRDIGGYARAWRNTETSAYSGCESLPLPC
jgi:hypothetical protein